MPELSGKKKEGYGQKWLLLCISPGKDRILSVCNSHAEDVMGTFILTEEQKDIVRYAREYADRMIRPVSAEWDRIGDTPMELYRDAAAKGFTSTSIPKEYGGLGLSYLTQALINEEISKGDVGIANTLGASQFACRPIFMNGTEEQKRYAAETVMGGDMAAFALTESGAGSDASAIRTTAVRTADGFVINGRKTFITNGPYARFYTVFAKTAPEKGHRGVSCFLIEADRPGVTPGRNEDKMGFRLASCSDVVFDHVTVPADHLIGEENRGYGLAMKILDYSRIGVGAEAVGLAQEALDLAVKYAKERQTFGKPIAQHQAIQFMIADMEMKIQAARALYYEAAELAEAGQPGFGRISSCAKVMGSDAAVAVTSDAVQIYSGYGYTKDYRVEKLYRDAKLLQIFEGTNQIQRMIIGGYALR